MSFKSCSPILTAGINCLIKLIVYLSCFESLASRAENNDVRVYAINRFWFRSVDI